MENSKSLASLADEATERYYKSVSAYRSSEYSANAAYDFRAGWEAAAALRAPTIAADERCERLPYPELSQRASDRRDAEHWRDDGYRTDEERRFAVKFIALDDALIAAEAKIERRNATYTKPGEGFVCFHCGERFIDYESAKAHFGEKPDTHPTCFATPSLTIAADDTKLVARLRYSAESGSALAAGQDRTMLEAADRIEALSATPSPTIAAVTDEMVEAALRTYATSPHLRELEQPFSSAPGPNDSEQARHDMRLAIEAALATPSPTIAAPSPSNALHEAAVDYGMQNDDFHDSIGGLSKAFEAGARFQQSQPSPSDEQPSEKARHEPVEIYGADVDAARNVLKRYRKGMWHINGAIVREALDAAYAAKAINELAALRELRVLCDNSIFDKRYWPERLVLVSKILPILEAALKARKPADDNRYEATMSPANPGSEALSVEDLKAIRERCEAHASGDFVICALYRGEECSVGCRDAWALLSEIERLKAENAQQRAFIEEQER